MAKLKYDVSDVEPSSDFKPIPVGLYVCRITECEQGPSKSSGRDQVAITLEVAKGDYEGRLLWDYIGLDEPSEWKFRQFIDAIGEKEKGSLDTDDVVGTLIQVRVKHSADTREESVKANNGVAPMQARPAVLLPMPENGDDPDAEEAEAEASGEDEEEELTYDELQGYDREDLEATVEANELDVGFNSKTSDDKLRERIADALGLEPDDEEGGDDEETDYTEWSVADLKNELKERGISTAGAKKVLVKKLEKDDKADAGTDPF